MLFCAYGAKIRFPHIAVAPRKVGTPPCRDRDFRAERTQTRLQCKADAPRAEDQHRQPLQYDRKLLHRDLDRALSRWYSIAQRKCLLCGIVKCPQSGCFEC